MKAKPKAGKKTGTKKKAKSSTKTKPLKSSYLREVEIKFKKRRVKSGLPVDQPVTDAELVYKIFKDLENETKEKLITISLDAKLKILCFEVVAIGSLSSVYVRPIEVIRTAIPWNPYGFIIVHNHPSGDSTPGPDDKRFTKELKKAIKTLGCELWDHIIIGENEYYSFAEKGLLK